MLKQEFLNIFKNRKLLIPIVAVLFIPVLYAAMFLWAFWDPYAQLEDLPVAIVNQDTGAELDGEKLAIGDDVTKNLIESQQFHFEEVTKEQGEQALKDQDYYMVIEIPANFSEHATTLLDKDPNKLVIEYKPNEGFNFLSAQIGDTAMEKIRAEVNKQVIASYSEKLFASISKMGTGFGDAADGAAELAVGADELSLGAADLKGYLEQLASGSIELADGTDSLAAGAKEASSGAAELNNGLGQLSSGAGQLQKGAGDAAIGADKLQTAISQYTQGVSKVKDGMLQASEKEKQLVSALDQLKQAAATANQSAGQLGNGAEQVASGISSLSAQLTPLLAGLPEEQQAALRNSLEQLEQGSNQVSQGLGALEDGTGKISGGLSDAAAGAQGLAAGHQQLNNGLGELTGSSQPLNEGAASLASGTGTISAKLTELQSGLESAQTGSQKLSKGLNDLAKGSDQLNSGTSELAAKSDELAGGSGKLVEGTAKLADGTSTLKTKLSDAAVASNEVTSTEETIDMASSPVEVDKTSYNHVPNYGTGFAPYFLSLGLFVGALMISIVFPLVQSAIKPTSGWAWATSKMAVLGVVGLAQALLAVAILLFGLGLEPENTGWFIATAIITSYTYLAIVQLLVSILGDSGRFVSILILILQLTTSAGTFPLELLPKALQAFNHWLPMTYSVQGFRAAISSADTSLVQWNAGIMLAFFAGAAICTVAYFVMKFKKESTELKEA